MAEKKRPRLRTPPAELPFRWGPKAPATGYSASSPTLAYRSESEATEDDRDALWIAVSSLPEYPRTFIKHPADKPYRELVVVLPRTWILALEALIQHWAEDRAPLFWAVAADRYFGNPKAQSPHAQRPSRNLPSTSLLRYPLPFPIDRLPELAGDRSDSQQERLVIFIETVLFAWEFWPDDQPQKMRALFQRSTS